MLTKYKIKKLSFEEFKERIAKTIERDKEKPFFSISASYTKYVESFNKFLEQLKKAEVGNFVSQYNVGMFFSSGFGVERNMELAKIYLKKSADQGFYLAIAELERMEDPKAKRSHARTPVASEEGKI